MRRSRLFEPSESAAGRSQSWRGHLFVPRHSARWFLVVLGTTFIDEWFAPSVLVSHMFGSTRFSFGATIALRREMLRRSGNLEALRDVLADDFWLGEFTRADGFSHSSVGGGSLQPT